MMNVVLMRLRVLALVPLALVTTGCFQFATSIHVKGDGSGTLNQTLLFTAAAIDQFRGLALLGGGNGRTFDPVSEEQARAAAATLGPGVSYISSTPISGNQGQGRDIVYAFTDINQLRLSEGPQLLGGARIRAQGLTNTAPVSFTFARQASGTALLRIIVPRPSATAGAALAPTGRGQLSPDQVAMFKQMLVGARLSIVVEPDGSIVRTNSQYVDGARVTLIDVSLDQLLDDAVLTRLQQVQTEEDAKAALANIPGVKVNFDQELAIEFTPSP